MRKLKESATRNWRPCTPIISFLFWKTQSKGWIDRLTMSSNSRASAIAIGPEFGCSKSTRRAIKKGHVFALLGPNGCGKTTLLKILLGALKPTAGTIKVKGQIAFVPQLFQVSFDYSVLDMVLMGRAKKVGLFSQPSAEDEEAALAALERFGMADFAHHPFHELSGGRTAVGDLRARAGFGSRDPDSGRADLRARLQEPGKVLDWIAELSHQRRPDDRHSRRTIRITRWPMADKALLMLGQDNYALGPATHVLTEENLSALYGVPIKRVAFEHEGRRVETLTPAPPAAEERTVA